MKLLNRKYFIFHSIAIMVLSVIIIVIIVLTSGDFKNKKNGFNRKFIDLHLKKIAILNIDDTARRISGISGNHIYMETNDPGLILQADLQLKAVKELRLPVKESEALSSLFFTFIDSPHVYIAGGNIPVIIQVNFYNDSTIYRNFSGKTFTCCAQIDPGSFVFRTYKNISGKWDQVFVKRDLLNGTAVEEKNISERKNDAGISTDGLLHYDNTSHRLIYVHYYNNSFICMDTDLNLIYKNHTIDTNETYTIAAGAHLAGKTSEYTNTNPVHDVNLESCVDNGMLYNNSNLIADNEDEKNFRKYSVIDTYSLLNSSYKGSFYIPADNDEKLTTFMIYKGQLFVLYPHRLVLYEIN